MIGDLCDDCMGLLSRVQLFGTPGTVACQVPLSMNSPRKEYRSGLPFPTLGGLPDPGIEPESPVSPALPADSFLLSRWGSMQSRRDNCIQSWVATWGGDWWVRGERLLVTERHWRCDLPAKTWKPGTSEHSRWKEGKSWQKKNTQKDFTRRSLEIEIEEKRVCLELKELKRKFREDQTYKGFWTTISNLDFIWYTRRKCWGIFALINVLNITLLL